MIPLSGGYELNYTQKILPPFLLLKQSGKPNCRGSQEGGQRHAYAFLWSALTVSVLHNSIHIVDALQ